jgi:DNA-binding CsgD family transcriptional regulator
MKCASACVLSSLTSERAALISKAIDLKKTEAATLADTLDGLTSGARRKAGTSYAAVAALFVHKAAPGARSPPELIARAYNLTPSELRVLFAIVDVGGVPEVTEALGVAQSTVRTHLLSVFAKTGTRRQADLVKLVAGFSNPLLGWGEMREVESLSGLVGVDDPLPRIEEEDAAPETIKRVDECGGLCSTESCRLSDQQSVPHMCKRHAPVRYLGWTIVLMAEQSEGGPTRQRSFE